MKLYHFCSRVVFNLAQDAFTRQQTRCMVVRVKVKSNGWVWNINLKYLYQA